MPAGGARHAPGRIARYESALVADLRTATARYPADERLWALIGDLRRSVPRFAELWEAHLVDDHESDTKTVHHPVLGPLTLDCDVLSAPGTDLRLVLLTAAPGTPDAEKLARLATADGRGLTSGSRACGACGACGGQTGGHGIGQPPRAYTSGYDGSFGCRDDHVGADVQGRGGAAAGRGRAG
ncbi:hypothetical protein [Streptomyces sp. NPDC101150]|uniref:MmyB family transcriptional regulator n=1 Tax=Streptomyces sp. NPDC101150 TaxID=3366114 RepID=UPI0037F164EE